MDQIDDKIVHKKIGRNTSLTVKEIMELVEKYKNEYPDREVFFDGDEFAICSRRKENLK